MLIRFIFCSRKIKYKHDLVDMFNINKHVFVASSLVLQDYEPSGTTPIRCEPDVPTKGTIESLRSLPMEALLEEFRENNPYESNDVKELKPSLIPRSPLTQLN